MAGRAEDSSVESHNSFQTARTHSSIGYPNNVSSVENNSTSMPSRRSLDGGDPLSGVRRPTKSAPSSHARTATSNIKKSDTSSTQSDGESAEGGEHENYDEKKRNNNGDDERRPRAVLLTVFFEGTANTVSHPVSTQIGMFVEACDAVPLSGPEDVARTAAGDRYKMAFDGCGVTDGVLGVLFAAGLDRQCERVVATVAALRSLRPDRPVRVVTTGLSRGGVACLKLIRRLSKAFDDSSSSPSRRGAVTASACLFDPVPGNAVQTGFPYTASWSMDLRDCRLLTRVLALYPYEPLPDVAMHAPCLSPYHPDTIVEEDVTLGCHQGALFTTTPYPVNAYDVASNLSFRRLLDFFRDEGVPVVFRGGLSGRRRAAGVGLKQQQQQQQHHRDDDHHNGASSTLGYAVYVPTLEHCVGLCREALRNHCARGAIVRKVHDRTGRNRIIVRRDGRTSDCRWLNRQHRQLEEELVARNHGDAKKRCDDVDENGGSGSPRSTLPSPGRYDYQLDLRLKEEIYPNRFGGPLLCGSSSVCFKLTAAGEKD